MAPITRDCRACGRPFTISDSEQEFFRELSRERHDTDFSLPWRCDPCRRQRRRARETVIANVPDEVRVCCDCSSPFLFGGRDRTFYASQGFPPPRRCRICRVARRSWQAARGGRG